MKNFFERARSRRAGVTLVVGTAGSVVLFLAAGPVSSASTPGPNAKVAVPQGIGAGVLRNATVFGSTPPSTPETVSFILKARDEDQLKASVESGSPQGYLSVRQFAGRYGQTRENIAALESYLGQFGLSTSSYADGLDVTATGTAGQFDSALSVQQSNFAVPEVRGRNGQHSIPAQDIHGTEQSPLLPSRIAQYVVSVLGLTNYASAVSDTVHTPKLAAGVKMSSTFDGNLTPADFARNYHLNPLYKKGFTGAGQTIGIVTLASVNPADPYFFWQNVLGLKVPANRISLVNVDGGSGPVSDALGSGETTLDVEQSGALAPDAKIVVYQAPNTDFGFADAFFSAASQNIADTVSASWLSSETGLAAAAASGTESASYVQAFDEAFLELAAQGQSTFVASGDWGAYTATADLGTTNLSVGNPGDSPFVTSAGGTTLAGSVDFTLADGSTTSVSFPAQRTWGWDWLWPLWQIFGAQNEAQFAEGEVIGTGGGFSADEQEPLYQRFVDSAQRFSAVKYLTPTAFQTVSGLTLPTAWNFNPSPTVTTGTGSGRAVPDVSANADPFSGYEEYFTGFAGSPLEGGWGGTSFVAPQLAGAGAVIDQYAGGRVGLWNPAIYSFANSPASPFTPLGTSSTSNDNIFYTGTPGQVYNVGSGLGTPDLTRLAGDFRLFTGESADSVRR